MELTTQMLPVLPNIIPDLMTHDPTVPTYFGSSIARKVGYDFYFDGGMYGFSWGLVSASAPFIFLPADLLASCRHLRR